MASRVGQELGKTEVGAATEERTGVLFVTHEKPIDIIITIFFAISTVEMCMVKGNGTRPCARNNRVHEVLFMLTNKICCLDVC